MDFINFRLYCFRLINSVDYCCMLLMNIAIGMIFCSMFQRNKYLLG